MEPLRASVIIPARNTHELLARCLDSLDAQQMPGGFETIVVDNASSDETPDLLRRRAGRVRVLTNAGNLGFGAANNQAAAAARGGVLVFINSDTELLDPDTLDRLARAAEDRSVGIAGPMLLNPDGSLQPSCAAHPSIGRALLIAAGLHRLLPDSVRAAVSPDTWSHDRDSDIGWVKGAALAIRADLFREVGGFWTTMYAEEEDLAWKVQERGLRVRLCRASRVLHVGNSTAGQRWSDAGRAARVANAELLILRAHYTRPRALAIRAITTAGHAARAFVHGALGHTGRAAIYRAMARTYASGARG